MVAPRSDDSELALMVAARAPSTRVIMAGAWMVVTVATSESCTGSAVASAAALDASVRACCFAWESSDAWRDFWRAASC